MEHRFSPTKYYATIGSHEPELTVASGDTIVTTTTTRAVGMPTASSSARAAIRRPVPSTLRAQRRATR